MSNTFVSVNDAVLVDTIGRAKKRLVFIATGLRPKSGKIDNTTHRICFRASNRNFNHLS